MQAVNLTDFMNRNDIRMIEGRRGLCFTDEAVHPIGIFSKVWRQNLQSHFTIERGVLSQIHLAHSARAQLRADFVAAEFCASVKRHHLAREIARRRSVATSREVTRARDVSPGE